MISNAYDEYRKVHTQTASPGELILMLYDGAIRFLAKAEAAINQADLEGEHNAILRAQDIICELIASLHLDETSLTQNLMALYAYMYRSLVEAGAKHNQEKVVEVRSLLSILREAWRQALGHASNGATREPGVSIDIRGN